MRPLQIIHPDLPPMRLVNARTGEHVGPCPICQGGTKRFHVWTKAGAHGRLPWRFWCRECGAGGLVAERFSARHEPAHPAMPFPSPTAANDDRPAPRPEHISFYRQLYELVALWAHHWLISDANPTPLAELAKRGISRATAERYLLGYALRDPLALPAIVCARAPQLLPYGEEAGIFVTDAGRLRTHWNLCGALVFPYRANGMVVDLRTRRSGTGRKTKSLPGNPYDRGAVFPMGWDNLDGTIDTIMLTESGEHKTIVPLQAYHNDQLSIPTLGHPGLRNVRSEWGTMLAEHGVKTVILAYDSQLRGAGKDGVIELTPEESQTILVGRQLQRSGLLVRVLRLPLEPGLDKEDLDHFLLTHGANALQKLIDATPSLDDYHGSLPRYLLRRANLPLPRSTHRDTSNSLRAPK